MKKWLLLAPAFLGAALVFAQGATPKPLFYEIKTVKTTPVKNQAMTGTCWCFSATSLLESEGIRKDKKDLDLSEMFAVRNIYIDKAKNYILRLGKTQFGEGGMGHDLINAIDKYGAVLEPAYSCFANATKQYNHSELIQKLQT